MNYYKAALVYKLTNQRLVNFEKRTLTVNAIDEKEAFQTLLIEAAQTLLSLQKDNPHWEYIGLHEFENILIAPHHTEMITTVDDFNDMDSFIYDIKQYVETLSNKIGLSA